MTPAKSPTRTARTWPERGPENSDRKQHRERDSFEVTYPRKEDRAPDTRPGEDPKTNAARHGVGGRKKFNTGRGPGPKTELRDHAPGVGCFDVGLRAYVREAARAPVSIP